MIRKNKLVFIFYIHSRYGEKKAIEILDILGEKMKNKFKFLITFQGDIFVTEEDRINSRITCRGVIRFFRLFPIGYYKRQVTEIYNEYMANNYFLEVITE